MKSLHDLRFRFDSHCGANGCAPWFEKETMRIFSRRRFVGLSAASAATLALVPLAGCASLGSSSASTASTDAASSSEKPSDQGASSSSSDVRAVFVMMSDTHVDIENERNIDHFTRALADITSFERRPDAVIVGGDITASGLPEQYDTVRELVGAAGFDYEREFVFALGNHDQGDMESTDDAVFAAYRDLFVRKTGSERVYYDRTISGQHLIVLGPDDQEGIGWIAFNFSDEQLAWLDGLLAADAAAGVPSFVVMHEPLSNTVRGSLEGQFAHDALHDDAALRSIIDRYPQTVFLSGHSHAHPDIQQPVAGGPLFVNDGAVATGQRTPGERDYTGAFGWLVSVYEDRIEFSLRDFLERQWIEGSHYVHDLP